MRIAGLPSTSTQPSECVAAAPHRLFTLCQSLSVKKFLAMALLLVLGNAAQAQLSLTGGTPIALTGYSSADILGTGVNTSGLLDTTLFADITGTLSVTFLGKKTDHLDSFTFTLGNLSTMTINNNAPALTTISGFVNPGILNFTFRDLTAGQSVSNGIIRSSFASVALLATTVNGVVTPNTAGGAYTYLLGFNDGVADTDYDDLVIGLKLTPGVLAPVPEPGTYALLLAGLGALGVMTRRRHSRR